MGKPGTDPIPPAPASTAGTAVPIRIDRDIEYARVGDIALNLDIYHGGANDRQPLPVVIWVHGEDVDKSVCPPARLVANGFAVVSVDYRPLDKAKYPAQIYDLKAAIRWLRANAKQYNLDGAHIGVWGQSLGGYLATMLGATADVKEMEGQEGNLDQSSRVQAVASFSGFVDMLRMDATAAHPRPYTPNLLEASILGGAVQKNLDNVKEFNPLTYASADDAPFLIVHGTADKLIPARQAEFLQIGLNKAGVENNLLYVPGAGHDFKQVETAVVSEEVNNFFDKLLRGNKHQRDDLAGIGIPADCWIDPFTDDLPGTAYNLYATPSRGPNTQASYRLYLPPGYDLPENARRRYPVIFYLHGLNDDSRKVVNTGYISRLDVAIRSGIMPAAIVVGVQAPHHAWYVDSPDGKLPVESVIIKDLIPYIDKTYRTIATREGRAIEGHSMGGFGSLHLGFKYTDLFGSVAAFAPALVAEDQMTSGPMLEMLNASFGGKVANFNAAGGWTEVEKNVDKIRGRTYIRLICGDKDTLLERAKWMSDILTRLNIEHGFTVSKGAPHPVKIQLSRLDSNPFEYYGRAFAKFK